ncbi:hypothetical protein ACE2AJ_20115 [Aquihabitans daechungensis]|uniref:hypothetical protein n=1 Tax=Aquihabitans daechungensis TaxID=1052257 RepID=UPI003BA34582
MTETSTSEPFDPDTAWADPPGMAKALVIGVAVGVAVSFFGVGGAFLAGGQGWGPSIGMGVFVAMWGGLGFGGMIGGVVWASRVEEAATRERLEALAAAECAEDEPVDALTSPSGVNEDSPSSAVMAEVAG